MAFVDSTLPRRLGFLNDAAHLLQDACPSLSRQYLSLLQDQCVAARLTVPSKVERSSCSRCGNLFVPGQNAKISLKPRKDLERGRCRKRKRSLSDGTPSPKKIFIDMSHEQGQERSGPTSTLSRVHYNCQHCGAISKYAGVTLDMLQQYDSKRLQQPNHAKRPQKLEPLSAASDIQQAHVLDKKQLPRTNLSKKNSSKKSELRNMLASKGSRTNHDEGFSLSDFKR
ncbi:hypothetical protein DFS34DRAFT_628372 [Phlyctochytrium arcticum]|nr:hypothetical protein DFS34DRAFT_628372 [Phlyctochytrium arcticum]